MKHKKIALLLTLLLCLSACGTAAPEPDAPVTDDKVVTGAEPEPPVVEPETAPEEPAEEFASEEMADVDEGEFAMSKEAGLSDHTPQVEITSVESSVDDDDGIPFIRYTGLDITVTIPGRPKAEEAIQFDLDQTVQLTRDEQLETQAIEDYAWAEEQDLNWLAYCEELDAQVVRADEQVLSLCVNVYTYTGGVHGYYYSYGVSYDTETGERLTLKNLSAGVIDLSAYARNVILTMCQSDEYKDLLYEDYKPYVGDVVQDSHFYLTDEGITFVAEPYLLGPYAAGQFEFSIPYDDLHGVVRDVYLK